MIDWSLIMLLVILIKLMIVVGIGGYRVLVM